MLVFLLLVVFSEILYLENKKSMSKDEKDKKNTFVAIVGLSDLAISTSATYIRHRSMSDIFSIYRDAPSLREYFPSTYAISHSHIINPHHRVCHEN